MRVGLVLGAGGVVGASWLIGALDALEAETGWRAVDAERIVGTSAGAVVGALAAERHPLGVHERLRGRPHARRLRRGRVARRRLSRRLPGSEYRLQLALPPIGPGSWRLALNTMRHLRSHSPAAVVAGWLPRGFISTGPISALVDGFVPGQLARPPELLGGRRRLQLGQARRLRPRRRPDGARRRRGRRVVRHPRLLPPGQDRRAPLRRRRHLLDLEPRPAVRRRPRPRRLPEPDVVGRPRRRRLARRPLRPRSCAPPPGAAWPTRPASCAPRAPTCSSCSPAATTAPSWA